METAKKEDPKFLDDIDLDLERGAHNSKKWEEAASFASTAKASSAYKEAKGSFSV